VIIDELFKGRAQSSQSSSEEEIGIGGFKLFARVNQSTQYKAQVPDFVLEDGSYVNDHIINNPLVLSINGEIGSTFFQKLQSYIPDFLTGSQQNAISNVSVYLPSRTTSQLSTINGLRSDANSYLSQLNRMESVGTELFDVFNGTSAQKEKDNQEQFIAFLESVYYSKQLIEIEMPYKKHTNMALTDLSIERNNTENSIKFTASFKKVQFAQIVYTSASKYFKKPSSASATNKKTESAKDKGSQKPADNKKSSKSLLTTLIGG